MCNIQDATAIYGMYKDFCGRLEEGTIAREFCDFVIKTIEKDGGAETLTELKVELTIEKIKEIYEKYHVIQLRDLQASEHLLIGCGNSPITDCICKGEGHNHEHEGYVTIDPEITKNPTLIGAFGTQKSLHNFLPKKFYKTLVSELSSIAENVDGICQKTLDCMAEDFKCYKMKATAELEEEKGFKSSMLFNNNSRLY